jgi:hypothetical protein
MDSTLDTFDSVGDVQYSVYSDIGKRDNMEDSYTIITHGNCSIHISIIYCAKREKFIFFDL